MLPLVSYLLQRRSHGMEIMDIIDTHTPTGGDIKDAISLYLGSRLCGQRSVFNRTDEVESSNPSRDGDL
jgi:hypothetical protein